MAYLADPNNILPVTSSINLPLFMGWYSTVNPTSAAIPPGATTTTGAIQRTGNRNGTLTLEINSQIYSSLSLSTGIPVVAGSTYTFSVTAISASSLGNSNWVSSIYWADINNALISTDSIATATAVGFKIRIPLSKVAPAGAVKAVLSISADNACILSAPTFSKSATDLGPLPPTYTGSKWNPNPSNLIPVNPFDGGFATMEGWVDATYTVPGTAGNDGILDVPPNTQDSIAYKESSSTTTVLGVPVSQNTTYSFGITENSLASLSAAPVLIRKEIDGTRTVIPMTYSSNGRWSATATSIANQLFSIGVSTLFSNGMASHPTFVLGTTDPGPLDPILFNGTYQPNSTNLIPVDSITGGFARMKNWKTALGDSVVDEGNNLLQITPGSVPAAVDNGDGTLSITPIPSGAVDQGSIAGTLLIYPQYSPVLPDNNDGTANLALGTTAYLINPDETYVLTGQAGSVTAGITIPGSSNAGTAPTTVQLKFLDVSGINQVGSIVTLPRTVARRSATFTTPTGAAYIVADIIGSTSQTAQFSHPTLVAASSDPGPLDPTVSGFVTVQIGLSWNVNQNSNKAVSILYPDNVHVTLVKSILFNDSVIVNKTLGLLYKNSQLANKSIALQYSTLQTATKTVAALWNDAARVNKLLSLSWIDNQIISSPKTLALSWSNRSVTTKILIVNYADNVIVSSPGIPIVPNPPAPSPPNPAYTLVNNISWPNRQTVKTVLQGQWQNLPSVPTIVTVNKVLAVSFANDSIARSRFDLQWGDRTLVSPPDQPAPFDPATIVSVWSNRQTVRSTFDAQWQDVNIPINSGVTVGISLDMKWSDLTVVESVSQFQWTDISVFSGGTPGKTKFFTFSWADRAVIRKVFSVAYSNSIPVRKTLDIQFDDHAHVRLTEVITWMNTKKLLYQLRFIWGNIPSRIRHTVYPTTFIGSNANGMTRDTHYALSDGGGPGTDLSGDALSILGEFPNNNGSVGVIQ